MLACLMVHPHDMIVTYDSSTLSMQLTVQSTTLVHCLLTNVSICSEELCDWFRIHQNEQLYVTIALCRSGVKRDDLVMLVNSI